MSERTPDWITANLSIERKAALNLIRETATAALEYQDDRMLRRALVAATGSVCATTWRVRGNEMVYRLKVKREEAA